MEILADILHQSHIVSAIIRCVGLWGLTIRCSWVLPVDTDGIESVVLHEGQQVWINFALLSAEETMSAKTPLGGCVVVIEVPSSDGHTNNNIRVSIFQGHELAET